MARESYYIGNRTYKKAIEPSIALRQGNYFASRFDLTNSC